jgi:hypothetical protein
MFDPQQALLDLLQPGGVNQTLFPPTSRYYGIPTATLVGPNGVFEIYLKRRFLPPIPSGPLQHHRVTQGERLDHIAFRSLGDSEQFWRIADVNTEMDASQLTAKPGRVIRIPIEGAQQ